MVWTSLSTLLGPGLLPGLIPNYCQVSFFFLFCCGLSSKDGFTAAKRSLEWGKIAVEQRRLVVNQRRFAVDQRFVTGSQ